MAAANDTQRPRALETPGFEDTGSFRSIERIAHIDTEGGDEPIVYGLGANAADFEAEQAKRTSLRLIVGGVAGAAALLAILVFAQPFGNRGTGGGSASGSATPAVVGRTGASPGQDEGEGRAEAGADAQGQPQEEEREEQPQPVAELPALPSLADIAQRASQLGFDGQDLSLPADTLTLEAMGGRVLTTQVPPADSIQDPAALAGDTALRAAALADALAGREVQGEGEGHATRVADVTWVVRNLDGDSYLAVSFPAGAAPSNGDGMAVLASAGRYRLSDSLYDALGGSVEQEVGETPSKPNGEYIWSTAAFPPAV